MKYLLDTNVISEPLKPRPNPGVLHWLGATSEADTAISVVTWAELRNGVEQMPDGVRQRQLRARLEAELAELYRDRMLPVDLAVADAWGRLTAARARTGRPLAAMDGFLAATVAVHGLALVTRNVRDFEGSVAVIVNPWC